MLNVQLCFIVYRHPWLEEGKTNCIYQGGRMKYYFLTIVLLLITFNLFGEEIKITYNDSTSEILTIPGDITAIKNFKMELRIYKDDEIVLYHKHRPISAISDLSVFSNLKTVELLSTFHKCTTLDFINSESIERVEISWGLENVNLNFIKQVPNLKILRLHHINGLTISQLDISNTNLEYLELSDCGLKVIYEIILNDELKYLHLGYNEDLIIDKNFVSNLNSRGVTLISDIAPFEISKFIETVDGYTVSYQLFGLSGS